MPTLITIVDTVKSGWLTVDTNDLYVAGLVGTKQMNIEKASINAINIVKDSGSGAVFIEVHTSNTATPYTISNDLTQGKFFPIQSVNGIAPADIDDLKNKILELL